jgi:hypothetical protein
MGGKVHAKVEPFLVPPLYGEWLPLFAQAIQVEGQHRVESAERLREIRAVVSDAQRRDFGDDAAGLLVLRDKYAVLEYRRLAHGYASLVAMTWQ